MAVEIGIISDTHGLIREEALHALEGADLIIHAGDAGRPEVLDALARIAPVHAVRGNVDTAEWAKPLPLTATLEVERARLFVIHNVAGLDFDPAARGIAAVIFGHSHNPLREMRNGVLFLNPGSAGPHRFRLPVSVARIAVDGAPMRAELIILNV
jgi:putative phosphoesterase